MSGREQQLEAIIRDTLWMACRYAHGRQTYAVSRYNKAARLALSLGVVADSGGDPLFAIDGSINRELSGLKPDEFKAARARWQKRDQIPNHCRAAPSTEDGR